jgi:hypothetical protein
MRILIEEGSFLIPQKAQFIKLWNQDGFLIPQNA